jgi:hypothetical protein
VRHQRFLFALKISHQPRFDAMLAEIAGHVLAHAGYGQPEAEEILDQFRAALDKVAAEGARDCDVEFRADGGQLSISVSHEHGRAWRFARALPD